MTIAGPDIPDASLPSFLDAVAFDAGRATVTPLASLGSMRAFVVGLQPGQRLADHPAPAPLCLLVVEGNVTITVDGHARPAPAGSTVVIGDGVTHALEAVGSARAIVVGVLA